MQGLGRIALHPQTYKTLHQCISETKKLWKTSMIGAICAFIAEEQLKKITDMNTFRVAISILKEFLDAMVWPSSLPVDCDTGL
jgi:hypothetical protein